MLGYMGEDAPSDVLATAYEIWNGSYASKLNEDRDAALSMDKQIAALRDAWNRMPDGPGKVAAWSKYQIANSKVVDFKTGLNQAIGKYNSVADAASKYSANMVKLPRVGMAFVEVGAATIILAAVALLGGWAVIRELRVWAQGSDVAKAEAKGYIEQTADLINAAGGSVKIFGDTAIKVAIAVGIVGVLYLGYRWLSGRRGGGGSNLSLAPAAPLLDLKPVEGKVLA